MTNGNVFNPKLYNIFIGHDLFLICGRIFNTSNVHYKSQETHLKYLQRLGINNVLIMLNCISRRSIAWIVFASLIAWLYVGKLLLSLLQNFQSKSQAFVHLHEIFNLISVIDFLFS